MHFGSEGTAAASVTPFGGVAAGVREREHTAVLQSQLSLTSHMCQQLLHGQNNLIRAVCERLDRQEPHPLPQVEEHMAMLQQYQMELEAYYHQLCESYARVRTRPALRLCWTAVFVCCERVGGKDVVLTLVVCGLFLQFSFRK